MFLLFYPLDPHPSDGSGSKTFSIGRIRLQNPASIRQHYSKNVNRCLLRCTGTGTCMEDCLRGTSKYIPQPWYWHGTVWQGSVRFNLTDEASSLFLFLCSCTYSMESTVALVNSQLGSNRDHSVDIRDSVMKLSVILLRQNVVVKRRFSHRIS